MKRRARAFPPSVSKQRVDYVFETAVKARKALTAEMRVIRLWSRVITPILIGWMMLHLAGLLDCSRGPERGSCGVLPGIVTAVL